MKTTISLAAENLLMKSWNMLDYETKRKLIHDMSLPASKQFDTTIVAFSAVVSASGHTCTPEAVDEFLVTSFQNDNVYDLKTHNFIKFEDEAFNDGVYKYQNPE